MYVGVHVYMPCTCVGMCMYACVGVCMWCVRVCVSMHACMGDAVCVVCSVWVHVCRCRLCACVERTWEGLAHPWPHIRDDRR